jgi:Mn-dependent DtxR family transcriptional regulator
MADKSYTPKQGQYLAFIYHYTKINRRPPSEADLQAYFRVSAPSVHAMVVTLAARGFIHRVPKLARSVRVLVRAEDLPDLE